MKKIILKFAFIFILSVNCLADTSPPDPGGEPGTNPPLGGGAPIGNGIGILICSAIIYVAFKYSATKKEILEQ